MTQHSFSENDVRTPACVQPLSISRIVYRYQTSLDVQSGEDHVSRVREGPRARLAACSRSFLPTHQLGARGMGRKQAYRTELVRMSLR